MKNIDILNDLVSTQHNDMKGIIAIEDHGINPTFFGLCKAHGIDTKKYFLIGFGISAYNVIAPTLENATVMCKVLLLEKEKYGSNFDEVKANVSKEDSTDVVEKTFSVTYKELGEYIKRLDFLAVTEMSAYISKMNIIK